MEQDFEEGGDDLGIEKDGGAAEDFACDFRLRLFCEIRRGIDGGIVVVCDGNDTRSERNVYVLQVLWETGSIPVLVMAADVGEKILTAGDGLEHIRTSSGCFLYSESSLRER